ncbi:unnamed protein product [Phyllotreta striolata]|uniref:Pre-rRNA-processing protein RIX1 N-terminal domain-containing protein n=1 Tax=Phyllotreta striolata TaxID=444603 RepID=A0A9N9XJ08_PHYSR|nr:unnamed protein product [Phyllotreta striolata]
MNSTVSNESILSNIDSSVFRLYLLNGPKEADLKAINKLLSASKTTGKGLELLHCVLNYCTFDTISEYVVNWMDSILKISAESYMENKLTLIGKLVEISHTNHDVTKKIVSDHLSKIVSLCLKQNKNYHNVLAALEVLTVTMRRYGSWFASQKSHVETYITSFMENSSDEIVEKAAVAFLLLQQVGNAGLDSVNHRNCFKDSFKKLCTTVHILYEDFFQNRVDIHHVDRTPSEGSFKFVDHSFDSNLMIGVTAKRIQNVLKFIIVMIKKGFPVCKDIQPMDVFNVVIRGTMPHQCITTSQGVSQEDYQFCSYLNQVQVHLIHLLRIFVYWLKNNSFPYAFVISKILIDCLKRSQSCKCFDVDVLFQESIYLTLDCWISTSRTGLNSNFQEQLITCILKDIAPAKTSISLKVEVDANAKKGNKNKQKPINSTLSNRNIRGDINKSDYTIKRDELRCELALKTLAAFFKHCYIRINSTTFKKIYHQTMTILNYINTSKFPHPYTNHKCILNLFELLIAFYEQDTLYNLPFISLTINTLSNYSSSENTEIADVCKRGLNYLEKVCQPVSLPFSIIRSTGAENKDFLLDCEVDLDVTDVDQAGTKTKIKKEIIILSDTVIKPANEDNPNTSNETDNLENNFDECIKLELSSDNLDENPIHVTNETNLANNLESNIEDNLKVELSSNIPIGDDTDIAGDISDFMESNMNSSIIESNVDYEPSIKIQKIDNTCKSQNGIDEKNVPIDVDSEFEFVDLINEY